MSSICQQYSTLHFMDVTSIFPICRRRRLLGNVFRYISDISRQGYLVRRRLKLELPSAMSGPCQHFTPLRNLTQTFSDGISSTPSESTDWWMSLPYLQSLLRFVRFLNVSGWISVMSLWSSHLVKQEKRTKMTFDNVEIESTWCWSTPCSQSLKNFQRVSQQVALIIFRMSDMWYLQMENSSGPFWKLSFLISVTLLC